MPGKAALSVPHGKFLALRIDTPRHFSAGSVNSPTAQILMNVTLEGLDYAIVNISEYE
jgi:hypothetical protein